MPPPQTDRSLHFSVGQTVRQNYAAVRKPGEDSLEPFPAALALYLIGMASAGVFQPVRQAYLHLVVAKEQRATVLSLASLVSSGGSNCPWQSGQSGQPSPDPVTRTVAPMTIRR